MILSDDSIIRALSKGSIKITPIVEPENIRPVGLRLHLGTELLVPQDGPEIDLLQPGTPRYKRVDIGPAGYVLPPQQFALGSTREAIQVSPILTCHLDGRSTLARLGLMIHCTAGVIDNNTDEPRTIVLELCNLGPVNLRLHADMPIGMLTFQELSKPISQPSASQYRGQAGVQAPDLEFHASGRHLNEGYRAQEGT